MVDWLRTMKRHLRVFSRSLGGVSPNVSGCVGKVLSVCCRHRSRNGEANFPNRGPTSQGSGQPSSSSREGRMSPRSYATAPAPASYSAAPSVRVVARLSSCTSTPGKECHPAPSGSPEIFVGMYRGYSCTKDLAGINSWNSTIFLGPRWCAWL